MKHTNLQPEPIARQSENSGGDYTRDRWQWLEGDTFDSIAFETRIGDRKAKPASQNETRGNRDGRVVPPSSLAVE